MWIPNNRTLTSLQQPERQTSILGYYSRMTDFSRNIVVLTDDEMKPHHIGDFVGFHFEVMSHVSEKEVSHYSAYLSPKVPSPGLVPTLARELEPFFWTCAVYWV